jgi:hypothetical protein
MTDPTSSFIPDDQSSFIPDEQASSFVPDTPTGHWEKIGLTTQWKPDKPVDIEQRPDSRMTNAISVLNTSAMQNMEKGINESDILPEWMKSPINTFNRAASFPGRFFTEGLQEPESVLGLAGLGKRPTGSVVEDIKVPEVLPPEVPKIRGLLEAPKISVGPTGRALPEPLTFGNPQEQARLLGHNIDANGNPIGLSSLEADLERAGIEDPKRLLNFPSREMRGGTAAINPNEPILPSAPKAPRTIAEEVTANVEDAKVNGAEPPIAAPIKTTGFTERQTKKAVDITELARKGVIESDAHALRRLGPAGEEIERLSKLKDTHTAVWSGERSARINKAAEGLAPEQIDEAISVVESGDKSPDPMVMNLVNVIRQNDKDLTKLMAESGSQMRLSTGELAPFEPRENYFPHKFDRDFFDQNKDQIIQSLMQEKGVSSVTAERILSRSRQNNPILSDALHERLANFPGYRRDLDVLHKHYIDMADRAFTDKYLGVNDIASKEPNIINSLIEEIGQKNGQAGESKARDIMSKFLKHDEFKDSPGVRHLTQVQAMTKLALSAPSNTAGGLSMIGFKGDVANAAKGIISALTKNGRFDAQRMGVLQSLFRDAADEVGYSSKFHYGNKWVEEFLRSAAGLTGKYQVESIFNSLKRNPTSSYNLARLKDLLLEKPERVLMQEKLTPLQLATAANRFTDLTQGRVNTLDLPHHWSNEPMANLLTQFKKFAFIQSTNIKNAMVQDLSHGRIHPMLKLALASQVFGEVAGDIKAVVRGQERPEGLLRVIDNASNAFGIGLVGEALKAASTGRPADVISFFAGPTAGMAADLTAGAVKSVKDLSYKPLLKSTVRQFIPIWGSQLAKKIPND